EFLFLISDAVLAAERSADPDAQLHDLLAHAEYLVHLVWEAAVEQDKRMEIAVAGMKDIRDAKAVVLGHAIDRNENFREPRSRDDGVHGDHIRRQTTHRAERAFAPEPQPGTLFVVFRDADVVRAILAANFDNGRGRLFKALAESVDFNQKRCGRIQGV